MQKGGEERSHHTAKADLLHSNANVHAGLVTWVNVREKRPNRRGVKACPSKKVTHISRGGGMFNRGSDGEGQVEGKNLRSVV